MLFFPYKWKIIVFYRSLGILTYEINKARPLVQLPDQSEHWL